LRLSSHVHGHDLNTREAKLSALGCSDMRWQTMAR